MEHWVEFEPKFIAMPAEPAAMTVPPVIEALSQSMAPLPPLVGPLTYVVPPDTVMEPLESRASPCALTVMVPPEMVSVAFWWSANPPPWPKPPKSAVLSVPLPPSEALMPSSDATMSIFPPLIAMSWPSRPSTDCVMSMTPPTMVRSVSAWMASSPESRVRVPPSM